MSDSDERSIDPSENKADFLTNTDTVVGLLKMLIKVEELKREPTST